MPISNEQKKEIAKTLVKCPKHYVRNGRIQDSQLCQFASHGDSVCIAIKPLRRNPEIAMYFSNKQSHLESAKKIQLPDGFVLREGNITPNPRGWISFGKTGCVNDSDMYKEIVQPGNELDSWKEMFERLRKWASKEFQCEPTYYQAESIEAAAKEGENTIMKENYGVIRRNRIVFGAPGTGKSYRLKEESEESFTNTNSERVTFYATYSYAQFVGTYKPVMKDEDEKKSEDKDEKIAYAFVPGPFLRMLVKALNGPREKFLLIIEEINRANAAAVFGDVFQLLDRGADGVSEYSIAASEDVKKYLEKALTEDGKQTLSTVAGATDMLKIPANLYLWATMNSADQGVFPLDTAFKRRWSFEYIGIDEGEDDAANPTIAGGGAGGCEWKKLRKFLNGLLAEYGVNEDKLMGPFFLKDASEFGSKVLMYLWEDAARMCRRAFFGEKIKIYSDLLKAWQEKGVKIFEDQKSVREGDLEYSYNDLVPQSGADAEDTNS